jgi:hypothetical protein
MDAVDTCCTILAWSTGTVIEVDVADLFQAFRDVSGHAGAVKRIEWNGQRIGLQSRFQHRFLLC